MDAARVCAERGHQVVLFEASDSLGGQLRYVTKPSLREAMSGIGRWLSEQLVRLNVDIRLRTAATADLIIAKDPAVVVVAKGGLPNKGDFEGADLTLSAWDVLDSKEAPGPSVLVADDQGDHQRPSIVEFLVEQGATVELAVPDRRAFSDVGVSNAAAHLCKLNNGNATLSPDLRLKKVYREGNRLVVVLENEYTQKLEERVFDAVVSEQGTTPLDALYHDLRAMSRNNGELDYRALLSGQEQRIFRNRDATFMLLRVGDCVASRNIHAGILVALRLCKDT